MSRDIMAIVSLDANTIRGGVPVFIADSSQQQIEIAEELGRLMRGDVFRLKNGMLILLPRAER